MVSAELTLDAAAFVISLINNKIASGRQGQDQD